MSEQLIHLHEHSCNYSLSEEQLISLLKEPNKLIESIDIKNKCFNTGYFIGLTWLADTRKALYVTPKLDTESFQIDYLRMLSMSIKHPEIIKHGEDLFEIQFNKPTVRIKQHKDLITPLIIVHFLQVVHAIVRKGLKKGYYKVENNLFGRVKGKVLVSTTLKTNTFKNKTLNTFCAYDEFGLNHPENRIIKKALLFVLRYIKLTNRNSKELMSLINFILPAFEKVDENISLNEVKSIRQNPFYSEYSKGVELSLTVLKRFGFNINLIIDTEEIEVPPFWINMPKIFEFHVLGELEKMFGNREIIFQANANYGDLDFLRTTKGHEAVIDAKYKPQYKNKFYEIDDIRQLSAYARDRGTFRKLMIPKNDWDKTVLNCHIIYPDQDASSSLNPKEFLKVPIPQFEKFYKQGISIPTIKKHENTKD